MFTNKLKAIMHVSDIILHCVVLLVLLHHNVITTRRSTLSSTTVDEREKKRRTCGYYFQLTPLTWARAPLTRSYCIMHVSDMSCVLLLALLHHNVITTRRSTLSSTMKDEREKKRRAFMDFYFQLIPEPPASTRSACVDEVGNMRRRNWIFRFGPFSE